MVGIRTFLRRTWGRVWIYSFFALLLMIALSFIQHVIGGINWEAFQYPAEDGKPNVFVDDINHPSELTSLLVGDNHLYLFYGRIDVVKVYDLDGQYLYSVNFRDGRVYIDRASCNGCTVCMQICPKHAIVREG